jgi:hypothetical protein
MLTSNLHPLGADQPTYSLSGGGGVLGLVLRSDEAVPIGSGSGHPFFQILRVGPNNGDTVVESAGGTGSDGTTLPAGIYRLYLITAAQGQVSLNFPTLPDGQLSAAPQVLTPFSAGPLPILPWSSSQSTVFGESKDLVSDGLVLGRVVVHNPAAGQSLELCSYFGTSDQTAGSSAYTHGCPGGTSNYSAFTTSTGDAGAFVLGFVPAVGRYGVGGNVSATLVPIATPETVQTYGMWMSYEPASSSVSSGGGSSGSAGGGLSGGNSAAGSGSSAGSDAAIVGGGGSWTTDTGASGAGGREERLGLLGGLSVSTRSLRVRGRRAAVVLGCSRRASCSGTVRLVGWSSRSRFALAAGEHRGLRLTLSARRASLLARRRRVRVVLEVRSRVANGVSEQRVPVVLVAGATARCQRRCRGH